MHHNGGLAVYACVALSLIEGLLDFGHITNRQEGRHQERQAKESPNALRALRRRLQSNGEIGNFVCRRELRTDPGLVAHPFVYNDSGRYGQVLESNQLLKKERAQPALYKFFAVILDTYDTVGPAAY